MGVSERKPLTTAKRPSLEASGLANRAGPPPSRSSRHTPKALGVIRRGLVSTLACVAARLRGPYSPFGRPTRQTLSRSNSHQASIGHRFERVETTDPGPRPDCSTLEYTDLGCPHTTAKWPGLESSGLANRAGPPSSRSSHDTRLWLSVLLGRGFVTVLTCVVARLEDNTGS